MPLPDHTSLQFASVLEHKSLDPRSFSQPSADSRLLFLESGLVAVR
jgi:hypothetical protein